MKKLLYIALFLPFISIAQTIGGQCLMTEAQRVWLRDNRFNQTTGKYVETNSGGNGFFGDVNDFISLNYYSVIPGAEQFLNQEQSTGYADQWTFANTDSPITISNSSANENSSPLGKNSTTGQYGIDHIHYAALLAYIWQDDSTVITFSGETKARSAHAFDLAEAVFNVLVEQSNDTKLDFSNATKYPIDIDGDGFYGSADIGAPLMYYIAKMEKYLHSYSLVVPILDGETYFEAENAGVETWLANAASWAYEKIQWQNNRYLANEDPTVTPIGDRGFDQVSGFSPLYYTSGGTGQVTINQVAQGTVNNIALDFIQMFQAYGILFNNTAYKTLAYDMYELAIKLGVFPDGSWFEFSRATQSEPSLGFNYAAKGVSHLAMMAYKHAVAVENGLTGVTDRGLYFDYSTSEGSDDLYTSGWATQTTSGGPKSLLLMIKNFGKWYRTSANDGYSDLRFAPTGLDMEAEKRPYVLGAAIANVYYDDGDLYNLYTQNASVGYAGPDYYQGAGVGTVVNDGPYNQWTLGNVWGRGGAMFAGFGLVGDMEGLVFSQIGTGKAIRTSTPRLNGKFIRIKTN